MISSFRVIFYRSFGRILVTCNLILHFLCEHVYPSTQLVNHLPQLTDSLITINCIDYSESQKSVLRQETVCPSCWLWDNAPNVIVILGASVCSGVGCYNLVLLNLGKPPSKYFSIIIYSVQLFIGRNLICVTPVHSVSDEHLKTATTMHMVTSLLTSVKVLTSRVALKSMGSMN